MHAATLRLFNAIQVNDQEPKKVSRDIFERAVKNGYILDPAITPSDALLDVIESIVGISGEKANAAFHKSWAVVRDSPMEVLVLQQWFHYVTTYGFERLGVYSEGTVYIPHEILELPSVREDIPLTVVKAMTAEAILGEIVSLGSGIALAQGTLDDIMTIVEANAYDNAFVQEITNRELKALLYDFYGLVPSEPVEFLRHLISKLTDESLLIKNDYLIGKIKEANGKFLDELLKDAPGDLASIFFRFKPLFLAMKSISRNKTFFNRLRKQADKLHKPLLPDYLNSVTAQVKGGRLGLSVLKERLDKASVFRKIRLAYALQYRLVPGNSIVYRVRNGRGWATEFEWPDDLQDVTQATLNAVLDSIAADIRPSIEGQTVYIPANVHYALPATEKQFTGHFPTGSFVSVQGDMLVGIHWVNTNKQVDLDLSMIGESGKFGWDAGYRSEGRDILFSGDVTVAPGPNGASELFYLKQGAQEAKIVMLNYYNFVSGDEVVAKILVAHESPENFGNNYMVDVNNIVASANVNITRKQNILGLIVSVNGENRFCFANVSVGNSITSTLGEQSAHVREYLVNSLVNSLDFGAVLEMAGANVVTERPDREYVDLSPAVLDKTTIIDLVKGVF